MADTKKPKIVKKKISDKQLIANRLNSMKSTGPRTARGRQRSSMNNLRSGMRSKKDVLPNENAALYEERRQGALKSLAPRGDAERTLVLRFVRLEWRGERGERAENARAAQRIHDVIEGAEQREAAEAERLMYDLNKCPENLRLLLRQPAGVRALVQEWSILGARLAAGKSLLATQRQRCLVLLGKRLEHVLCDDPVATRWARALIGGVQGAGIPLSAVASGLGGCPEWMCQTEFDIRVKEMAGELTTKEESRALLAAYAAEEIGRLTDLLAKVEPLARRDRALEAEEAGMDTTPDGARLGQQILASYRGSDAALRRLDALQNPPRRGPGRGPKKPEAPAPTAPAPAQEPPAAAAPSNPEPAQAVAEPTVEAISQPQTVEAISEPQTVEPISEPQTVEPISTQQTVEAISDQPTSADDLGAYEPTDAELKELHERIQPLRQAPAKADGPAPTGAGRPRTPAQEEQWQQWEKERRERLERERRERLERLDREQREWREAQARRFETFLENNPAPPDPDPGGPDPTSGGAAGRGPPGEGTG
jgi:hypothetical protein